MVGEISVQVIKIMFFLTKINESSLEYKSLQGSLLHIVKRWLIRKYWLSFPRKLIDLI